MSTPPTRWAVDIPPQISNGFQITGVDGGLDGMLRPKTDMVLHSKFHDTAAV
ncbi:MAG: hypothetical protein ACYCZI_05670 [Metallibacterium scheffleri]|jgi:hypothetical protein